MSAAIAMAPSPAPHDRSSFVDLAASNSTTPAAAAATAKSSPPQASRPASAATTATPSATQRNGSGSPKHAPPTSAKPSPTSARSGPPPKIVVKQEPPSSPELSTSRHRPRKLDLSKNTISGNPATGRPGTGQLTGRDTGGLGIQDVGLACLSPGFVTQDPAMREQLQRSMSVREQQRHIIESRLQQTAKGGESIDKDNHGGTKTAGLRRKAPPGLSIVAPSHEQFANERMIQSAPLNQSFTGRHQPHPLTRHVANQPSTLSNTSHIHHVQANQTNNRLPPITDVFAGEGLGAHRDQSSRSSYYPNAPNSQSNSSHSNTRPTFPSPGHASAQPPGSARQREYKSAEEAQAELAGGRPELLPRIVHYNSHQQPPTPPSPLTGNALKLGETSRGRRRNRAEYEEGVSPPLGNGPSATRRGPFGAGRDSPESQRRKKEEFISLCERAWDLFHS